jgi:electron transfer flavoprotein alpha subunit
VSGLADTPGVARTILVVAEPPAGAGDAAAAAARVALAAEANRLTAALDALVGFATWRETAEPDFPGLAAVVAGAARSAGGGLAAVLIQDGDLGRQLAPLVAMLLGSAAVLGASDARVTAAAGLVFVKPVYGGWLEQAVWAAPGFVPVATLDLAGLELTESAAAQAAAALADAHVLEVAPAAAPGAMPRVRHLETRPPDARSVDLVHAKRIVTAGMGTANETLLAAVAELADLLEGSVGATRPVVDEGRLPKERLIGQTGRTVAPELYVALGVSGSPHHMAGVRKADRVVSINRDVRAPIFQFSDVGYVADLEEVLPALIDKIKAWRDAPAGGDPVTGGASEPGGAA